YVGLRHRIAILSESYSYAPFKDRVLASRGFVRSICEYVAANKARVRAQLAAARGDTRADEEIVLRSKAVPLPKPHRLLGLVEATAHKDSRRVAAGTFLVRTAQPLGDLAAYLLEPQAADGLCTWNFFDDALAEGKDFPVLRLPAAVPLTLGRARPLTEDRTF